MQGRSDEALAKMLQHIMQPLHCKVLLALSSVMVLLLLKRKGIGSLFVLCFFLPIAWQTHCTNNTTDPADQSAITELVCMGTNRAAALLCEVPFIMITMMGISTSGLIHALGISEPLSNLREHEATLNVCGPLNEKMFLKVLQLFCVLCIKPALLHTVCTTNFTS